MPKKKAMCGSPEFVPSLQSWDEIFKNGFFTQLCRYDAWVFLRYVGYSGYSFLFLEHRKGPIFHNQNFLFTLDGNHIRTVLLRFLSMVSEREPIQQTVQRNRIPSHVHSGSEWPQNGLDDNAYKLCLVSWIRQILNLTFCLKTNVTWRIHYEKPYLSFERHTVDFQSIQKFLETNVLNLTVLRLSGF